MNVKSGNFLDLDQALPCISCSFRRFDPEECHVTRVSDSDVLLLMLEGELIFWEDGRRISLLPGQWYIQKAGLVQEGREPSRLPFYYYLHFLGSSGRNSSGRSSCCCGRFSFASCWLTGEASSR